MSRSEKKTENIDGAVPGQGHERCMPRELPLEAGGKPVRLDQLYTEFLNSFYRYRCGKIISKLWTIQDCFCELSQSRTLAVDFRFVKSHSRSAQIRVRILIRYFKSTLQSKLCSIFEILFIYTLVFVFMVEFAFDVE